MSDRVLQVEVRRGVTTLTLDSPANRNALSRAMRAQLRSALTAAIADDSVQVVVLDHTGWVFCSGTDLPEAANGVAEDRGVDAFPALLQMSPPALAETRRLLRAACTGPSAEQFPELLTSSARFSAGEEGQEGIAAFREKRPARWVPA
jgi:methylglutaconyl-CoA hydratase